MSANDIGELVSDIRDAPETWSGEGSMTAPDHLLPGYGYACWMPGPDDSSFPGRPSVEDWIALRKSRYRGLLVNGTDAPHRITRGVS